MGKHSNPNPGETGAAVTDPVWECEGKGACELRHRRFADTIMPHILNLYGSCATAKDFDMYAPNASFEDPLTHAQGVKQIKSAFYSLSKVFGESRIVEYHIQESDIAPGKKENDKIVRHEDWWDKKPLRNRDTVSFPLVGRVMEMGRRGLMLATHAMMGFGKDPGSH
ncbi:hypothetical protein Bca101_012604 [Brassica carinata]